MEKFFSDHQERKMLLLYDTFNNIMDSIETLMKGIELRKEILIRKNGVEAPEKAYRNVENFFDDIEEDWREIKISALPFKHPGSIVSFSEELTNFFLDYLDIYFEKINRNHTVIMSELLSKVSLKIDGISVSEKIKSRINKIYERNHWHGH